MVISMACSGRIFMTVSTEVRCQRYPETLSLPVSVRVEPSGFRTVTAHWVPTIEVTSIELPSVTVNVFASAPEKAR